MFSQAAASTNIKPRMTTGAFVCLRWKARRSLPPFRKERERMGHPATYMTALSWADLTYVLPATSLGYVLLALVARFVLHEHVSPLRWLGIVLITGGVGFVAGGPELTKHPHLESVEDADAARAIATAGGER
jgi:drug/metabolite transporter (DMT)-like permease